MLFHIIRFVFAGAVAFGTLQAATAQEKTTPSSNGYNAPWPKDRGFQVGQTVPNIPLFNMKGEEVRLSKFLGKQYILYCWASW